ncbi:hypothetical protein BGZ98_003654 [Dissophora globulifera]|nr:hypothetical protein BGZ98_003654 [Dissophora globulifera]
MNMATKERKKSVIKIYAYSLMLTTDQRQRQQQQLSTFNPDRHPLSNASVLRQQPQQDQSPQHTHQQQQQQQQQQQFSEKPAIGPGRPGGPRLSLSLDTSDERLQTKVIRLGNKRYLKLFSPILVESPISYLNHKQLDEDKKLWENGPNEAFQKQLETEKREAYRARSKQQLRGFFMGLWLGSLMGVLMLQQTSAKMHFWRRDALSSYMPLVVLLILVSSVVIVRSGTRCTIAAVATCAAVLTCFATLIISQSRYSTEFRLAKRNPPTPMSA